MLYKTIAYKDWKIDKKFQLFQVSQPFTVYEVDFLILEYDFGWLQNRQSHRCFFQIFPSQKVGCSTQILSNLGVLISCFKAMPSFLIFCFQKTISSIIIFFLVLCISLIEFFEYIFPSFFGFIYGCSFFWMLTFLEMLIRTQHTFCWEGQKGS